MELPEQDRQALIEAARRRGQGGAAFGVYPSSGKRPEKLNVSRDVNMPAQVARGWAAGLLGLPGDIESLGRLGLGLAGADVSETPVLPTSDFYREYLPGYDPAPAAKFASGLGALAGGAGATRVAGAAVKGAKATGKALGPTAAGIAESYLNKSGLAPELIAYHGTPHRFAPEEGAPLGKFRSEKIGTGEGAQAFGHGLYFAEAPVVAKSYQFMGQNWFDTGEATYKGKSINSWYEQAQRDQERAFRTKNQALEKDANARLAFWENVMTHKHPEGVVMEMTDPDYGWPEATKFAQSIDLKKFQGVPDPGSMYTVDIPDEKIARMLDLDRPLTEQPESIRQALAHLGETKEQLNTYDEALLQALNEGSPDPGKLPRNPTGLEIINSLKSKLGPEKAAEYLRSQGIPGVRYFDEQSRNLASDAYYGLKRMQDKLAKLEAEYKDNPSEALKNRIEDAKQELKSAERGVSDLTRNIVVFPGEEESVKIIERKAEGGLVEDTDAIAAKLTGMDKDKALTHALRMANAKHRAQSTYKTLA